LPTSRIVAAALIGLVLTPAEAGAHAILLESKPAAAASVAEGRLDMSFRYNSRIDRARSRLTLTGPDHGQTVLRIVPSGPPDLLETSTNLAAPGAYVVRWQVLAIDGHITRGDVPFTVTDH
jgi:methionine-rich copper-binding protein CopC